MSTDTLWQIIVGFPASKNAIYFKLWPNVLRRDMKVSVGGLQVKNFFRGGVGLLAKGGSARFMFFWGGSFFQRVEGGWWGEVVTLKETVISFLFSCESCGSK